MFAQTAAEDTASVADRPEVTRIRGERSLRPREDLPCSVPESLCPAGLQSVSIAIFFREGNHQFSEGQFECSPVPSGDAETCDELIAGVCVGRATSCGQRLLRQLTGGPVE